MPTDIPYMKNELISHISNTYKKLLIIHKDISIRVDDRIINYSNVLNEIKSKKLHRYEKIPKSVIHVYKNKEKYIPIVKHNYDYHRISFKDVNSSTLLFTVYS